VSERCELGEGKEAVFAVKIPEKTGSFKTFCELLGGINITEFNYRFSSKDEAYVFVGVKLKRGLEEYAQLTARLEQAGYEWCDLSQNELAKLHVRHMVGGKPPVKIAERVFGFEFPEYPGALMHFLNTLGAKWNITLFHYRNHGAAEGLVLVGFDLPEEQDDAFKAHLGQLGFIYEEHTHNPAYQFFLGNL
jgi:threonine dehydratase